MPKLTAMASAPLVLSGVHRGSSIPIRRLTNAELFWLAFVIVQALDGAMSYLGVAIHGPAIEGNPLVAWYLAMLGPALGFMAAKLFAVTCGAVLHLTARHHWVAALTAVYLVLAIGPWIKVLSVSF